MIPGVCLLTSYKSFALVTLPPLINHPYLLKFPKIYDFPVPFGASSIKLTLGSINTSSLLKNSIFCPKLTKPCGLYSTALSNKSTHSSKLNSFLFS